MKLKYILSTVLFIGFAHTSQAENHTLSPKLAKDFEIAVKNVENKNFLTGEFSAADMMTGHAVIMSKNLGIDFSNKPFLESYIKRLLARPALKKAWSL